MPVSATLAAYVQWVDNVQRANFAIVNGLPALVTNNVPQARIRGFEGSLMARPMDWLEFGASGTYTDARFTQAQAINFGIPVTYGPYGDVPKWSGTAYFQLTQTLSGNAGKATLRGDIYGQTSFYFSNLGGSVLPGTRLPGYALVNLRLSWSNILGSRVTAALYARNLFDKGYYTGGLPIANAVGTNSASPGRPRTFGGEIRFDF